MANMNLQGGYFAPENYLKVNTGGSHEENPNGGVQIGVDQQGTPNMLEQGEPVYNDFVYSDNIAADAEFLEKYNLPKKYEGWLYSRIADDLFESYSAMPLDPIEKNGADVMLSRLAECQEEQKRVAEEEELKQVVDSLSPEEQDALAQMMAQAQQAQMPQQEMPVAPEEQAQAEAMPYQPSPEEIALPVMANGGPMNRFDDGGEKDNWLQRLWHSDAGLNPDYFPSALTLPGAFLNSYYNKRNEDGSPTFGDIATDAIDATTLLSGTYPLGSLANSVIEKDYGDLAGQLAIGMLMPAGMNRLMSKWYAQAGLGKNLTEKGLAEVNKVLKNSQRKINVSRSVMGTDANKITNLTKRLYETTDPAVYRQIQNEISDLSKNYSKHQWRAIWESMKLPFEKLQAKGYSNLLKRANTTEKIAGRLAGVPSEATPAVAQTVVDEGAKQANKFWNSKIGKGIKGLGVLSGIGLAGTGAVKAYNSLFSKPEGQNLEPSVIPMSPIDTTATQTPMPLDTLEMSENGLTIFPEYNRRANGGPVNKFYNGNPLVRPGQRYLEYTQLPTGRATYKGFAPREGMYDTLNTAYVYANGKPMPQFDMWAPFRSGLNVSYGKPYLSTDRSFYDPDETEALLAQQEADFASSYKYPETPIDIQGVGDTDLSVSEGNALPRLLDTSSRYAKVAGDALLGLYDATQPADKYTSSGYRSQEIGNRLPLVDPRFNPMDINQSENAFNNQENALLRNLRLSGNPTSLPASVIAADYAAGANRGMNRAQSFLANEQAYNNALAGVNNNITARSQNDFNVSRYNAQNRMDAQNRNIPLELQKQMLNYQSEAQKWAAISNQINNSLEGLRGIGEENFAMNQINTNPYFEGYGMSPYGMVNYMTQMMASKKAAEEKAKAGMPSTPNPVAAATSSLQPTVNSYADSPYITNPVAGFMDYTLKAKQNLTPEAKEYLYQMGMYKKCGGKIKRNK